MTRLPAGRIGPLAAGIQPQFGPHGYLGIKKASVMGASSGVHAPVSIIVPPVPAEHEWQLRVRGR